MRSSRLGEGGGARGGGDVEWAEKAIEDEAGTKPVESDWGEMN